VSRNVNVISMLGPLYFVHISLKVVHDLAPSIFDLAAPPVLPRFFLQILMVSIFYFNLFPAFFKSSPFGLETAHRRELIGNCKRILGELLH